MRLVNADPPYPGQPVPARREVLQAALAAWPPHSGCPESCKAANRELRADARPRKAP